MVEIKHSATRLDEVRIQRSVSKKAVAADRPVPGGLGWRPGVPHILLYAGDHTGASAWPLTQDLALPAGAYTDTGGLVFYTGAEILDWSDGGYVQPASPRATGSMHINHFKSATVVHPLTQTALWVPGVPVGEGEEGGDGAWSFPFAPGAPSLYLSTHDRFGYIGDWWLGDPDAICNSADTLTALAALDINVACIAGSGDGEFPDDYGMLNKTRDEWNLRFTRPDLLSVADQTRYGWIGHSLSRWELGGDEIAAEGAALAHLTGAVDDEGRNLGWSLFRYNPSFEVEPIADLAARITADVLAHAARLGNGSRFDVGFLLDDTGSFSGSQGRAAQTFLALIDTFRDAGLDIFVAVARYSDYAQRTHFNGGNTERPYVLQYPMAAVVDDEQRDALVEALGRSAPGNGGGDTPETQWEAFYQIASGAGIDANHNGSNLDSGVAGVPGLDEYEGGAFSEQFYRDYLGLDGDLYETSVGSGWYYPGASGDVPPFTGHGVLSRGTATVADRIVRTWAYDGQVE